MSKQELLDKLKQQQARNSQKINIVEKPQKTKKRTPQDLPPIPSFVPKNQSQMSQTLSEDTYMRKTLKFISSLMTGVGDIDSSESDENSEEEKHPQIESETESKLLKQAFKVYKNDETKKQESTESNDNWSSMTIAEKNSFLQDQWKSLPNISKKDYVLQSLEVESNAPYERKQFINQFRRLSDKLQNLFIKHYLSRTTNYTNLFSTWIRNPSISEAISQNERDDEKASRSQKDLSSTTNIVKSEILKNLLSYLDKKGFKPSPQNTTISSIISEYTIDRQIQDKIYVKSAKNYLNLLELLSGNEIVNYISPADLCSEIERMEKKYSAKLQPQTLKQIQKLSRSELVKSLQEFKTEINLTEVSDTVLKILLIFYKSQSRIKSTSIAHALRIAQQKLEETQDPKEIEMLQREISFLQYNLPETDHIIEKEEQERQDLISKLSRITSFSPSHWNGWTLSELKERYKSIQEGDEYWQEFQRETLIEALMEITGRSVNWYTGMSTNALLKEFERVEKSKYVQEIMPKKVKDSAIHTLKCFKNFESYKWLSGKVQAVWIADPNYTQEQKSISPSPSIKPYSENDHILINNIYFFRANKEFFNLQCNKNSKRRIQEQQVLTCFNIHNKPIKFIVGYTISGTQQQLSQYSRQSIKLDSEPYIFVIQDEEIFRMELESLKTVTKTRNEQVAELLKQSVNDGSIEVASRFLSQGLRSVAPQNKDYNQISPYVQIAIKSVLTGPEQTTKDLYSAVASVIVYLNLTDAVIFRKRIEGEYYLPDILMSLSQQDKFPEVFDPEFGASDQTKENILSYITTQSQKIVTDMADFQYRSLHPTITRPWNPINSPEIEKIKYSESVCINLAEVSDTPKENIVFYTDKDDQTYCFDIDKLSDQFNSRNFINPKTGNAFSKDFIRRYTVSYYDYNTKQTYTFPFEKLYKQLKSGDLINKKTGTPFDLVFAKNILKGQTFNKSRELRLSKFKRLDYNTSKCENPQDIIDEPIESIIYYIDQVDNKKYCFSIPKLAPIVQDSGINPYTDRRFSKEFLTNFQSRYNMVLIQNGFTITDFGEKYGSQNWDSLETVHDQNLRKLWESYDSRKEPIIPDLWNIVISSLTRLEANAQAPPPVPPTPPVPPVPPTPPVPPVPPTPPARMGVHKNSYTEDEDDDRDEDDDDEDSTESEDESSEESEEDSKESEDDSEEESEEDSSESQKKSSKKSGSVQQNFGNKTKRPREEVQTDDDMDVDMDVEMDENTAKKSKMVRGEKLGVPPVVSQPPPVVHKHDLLNCKHCNQKDSIFKTFVFVNDTPEVIGFCSTDCACKIDEDQSNRHFFKYKSSKKSQ